jgi:hypothetical protein
MKVACLAALLATAFFGTAPQAHANIVAVETDSGGSSAIIFPAAPGMGPINVPLTTSGIGVTITDFSISGFNGSTSNALTASLSVHWTGGSIQTVTIQFAINGYTLPTGSPLSMTSGAAGTSIIAATGPNNVSFQAYFDPTNSLQVNPQVTVPPAGTNGVQVGTDPFNSPNLGTGDPYDTGDVTNSFANPAGTYSLHGTMTFTLFPSGANMQFTSHIFVNSPGPVPEPADLVLLLSGSPVLGLGYWLRRRKAPTKSAA